VFSKWEICWDNLFSAELKTFYFCIKVTLYCSLPHPSSQKKLQKILSSNLSSSLHLSLSHGQDPGIMCRFSLPRQQISPIFPHLLIRFLHSIPLSLPSPYLPLPISPFPFYFPPSTHLFSLHFPPTLRQ
jgi:hypothetical protein